MYHVLKYNIDILHHSENIAIFYTVLFFETPGKYDCELCNCQNVMNFGTMNTALAILITMGQVGYLHKRQINDIILHSCIQLMAWNLWGHVPCYLRFGRYFSMYFSETQNTSLFLKLFHWHSACELWYASFHLYFCKYVTFQSFFHV